jgi:nucleoside-diphosphate-sugar epimerase
MSVRATYHCSPPFAQPGPEWHRVPDLTETDVWDVLLRGADVVVHLAALAHQTGRAGEGRWPEFRRINVEGTAALARGCGRAGTRRLVFLSSIAAAQGDKAGLAGSPERPGVETDYGRSKLEAERAIERELASTATDWCVLRPPLVFGPGNPGNMRRLLRLVKSGIPLPFARIDNLRSFIFVENLVDAVLTVVRHQHIIRSTFSVTDGTDLSTPALVRALGEFAGKPARLLPVPVALLRVLARGADVAGSLIGRSLAFDSYSVARLTESLWVDGSLFRNHFAWAPPFRCGFALKATCSQTIPAVRDTAESER